MSWFTVRAPASSANLGPGFDALGLALGVYLTCRFRRAELLSIRVEGRDAVQGAAPPGPGGLRPAAPGQNPPANVQRPLNDRPQRPLDQTSRPAAQPAPPPPARPAPAAAPANPVAPQRSAPPQKNVERKQTKKG